MLVKILGAIDIIASITVLALIFGIEPLTPLVIFSSSLLGLKGLFILTGDMLSSIDLVSAAGLILSLIFTLPPLMLWIIFFVLLAKGFISFL
jgi:hypothetical protein